MTTLSYLICCTPRSGSNLLCEALKNTRLAGRPHQYFWAENESKWAQKYALPLETDYAAYVRGIVQESATGNGVFGFKSMWDFLLDFERRLRALPEFASFHGSLGALLAQVFPRLKYIHITRGDLLAQAVSLARALQTQLWTSKQQDARTPQTEPQFDAALIAKCREDLRNFDSGWEQFFRDTGVTPFRITYENLVDKYEQTTIEILQWLDISIPRGAKFRPRELKKQGDDLNARWARQFAQLEAAGAV